ncbi:MAG: PD-(D/E)XK nuclease family transposase [Lachnospiraceae bacterium]|nr:PD-(D/E)XK nuclease family transposase [Lachnospiraceae bacterium]
MTEQERSEKLNNLIKDSIPLTNDVFMIFAINKEFCQEFLRVILEDDELEVIENDYQKVIPSAYNKKVMLDMLCRLKGGAIVNVEIQLVDEEYRAKRIFSYAAKIRVYDLKKGQDYKDASEIIIIYLTLKDIFQKGSTVYEVKMDVVSDQGEIVDKFDAGLRVLFVNTEGLTNETINDYLKILTDKTTINSKYKITSKIKEDLFVKGGAMMSKEMMEILDDVRDEAMEVGIEKGKQELMVKLYKDNMVSKEYASSELHISVDEFLRLVI